MITSSQNSQIRRIRELNEKAKARREAGLFVIEGEKLFAECPSELREAVFVSESFARGNVPLLENVEYEVVEDDLFSRITDTKTPQGILALVRMMTKMEFDVNSVQYNAAADLQNISEGSLRSAGAESADSLRLGVRIARTATEGDDFQGGGNITYIPTFILLENLQDPGNIGTILRTAEAAGVTGIILGPTCADIYSPKVVRATMGSIFRVPFLVAEDLADEVRKLQARGICVAAAHLDGDIDYDRIENKTGLAFLIGNEGKGLSEELTAMADLRVRIPMAGRVESLNAAVAAALLMYQGRRALNQD